MIKLINGRGQLGDILQKRIKEENYHLLEDISIYHTWNIMDKSEKTQRSCYNKFASFIKENPDERILFISTYSQTDNPYNYYKQLAETSLLSQNPFGRVVRLPTLIGKGICEKFRDNLANPEGDMELMSLTDAADQILYFINSKTKIRNFRIYGTKVPATLVKDLILFGANKNENT